VNRKQGEHHNVRKEECRGAEINPEQARLLRALKTASGLSTQQQSVSVSVSRPIGHAGLAA
jgi:hypothetical protein